MKTDAKLKVENLESELFIADLGKVRGGESRMSTMAMGEEDSGASIPIGCGPADGPYTGQRPYFDAARLIEEIMTSLPGRGLPLPDDSVTTLALGEE